MEELTRPEPFEGTNSSSNYIPLKSFTKYQCNHGWSIFEQVVLVLLIVSNFALLLIVLPVVSSNSIKLSYIMDNLESSHGIHNSSHTIVNNTHGIMNLIKEQVDWINTTQEQMKGVIFTKLDDYETDFSKFDAILEKSNSIEDRALTINADQQLIKDNQNVLARRTNEIECSIGSDANINPSPPADTYVQLDLVQLAKNNEVKTFFNWGKEFSVTFDFIAKKAQAISVEYSILHISANGHWHQDGDRIPAVFSRQETSSSQRLEFRSSVSGNKDDRFNFYYQLNQLYHIEISQENAQCETTYNVKIDGTIKHSVKNTQVQVFDQVKLYLSSPWLETFGPYGEVRNLEVVNGKPTETPGSIPSGHSALSNQKCKQEGLRYKIDTLTNLIEHSLEVTAVNKDELDSKVDSTLSKVEGLMAKSGEIEIRFNEVDNIHQEIKDEQSTLDEKVENIINAVNDLKTFLPIKQEEDEVQVETTTKSSFDG